MQNTFIGKSMIKNEFENFKEYVPNTGSVSIN